MDRLRRAPGSGDGRRYISWLLRLTGRLRASLDEAEHSYRLDMLDPMSANLVALARMATGQVAEAVPVYEELVARIPNMSFPISSLLRAHAFLRDWAAVDRLLAVAATRPLREFQDTIPIVRAKRDPTTENLDAYRSEFEAHVAITGGVDLARMVYAAHLGLVGEAYRAADSARLGPVGAIPTSWAPTAIAPRCCSRPACPSCATTHDSHGCARDSASWLLTRRQRR